MTFLEKFLHDKSGGLSTFMAFMLIPTIFVVGASIDYSRLSHTDALLQDAADAAALAGALAQDRTDAEKQQIAADVFAANAAKIAFLETIPTPTVVANKEVVQVTTSAQIKTTFMSVARIDTMPATQSSIARLVKGSTVCVLALDPEGEKAVNFRGTGTFLAKGCAIHVNSQHVNALASDGGQTPVADAFCVRGYYSGLNYDPMPRTNCSAVTDPYANLETLEPTSCDYTNTLISKSTITLYPGVYCGGLTVKAHSNVTLEPGVYVMQDGPFVLESWSQVAGDGVTFYLTGSNTGMIVRSGTIFDVSAPQTGPYAGIVIHQEEESNPGYLSLLEGGGGMDIMGIVHMPTQSLRVSGGGEFGALSPAVSFISYRIDFAGNQNTTLSVDHTLAGIPPMQPRTDESVRLTN